MFVVSRHRTFIFFALFVSCALYVRIVAADALPCEARLTEADCVSGVGAASCCRWCAASSTSGRCMSAADNAGSPVSASDACAVKIDEECGSASARRKREGGSQRRTLSAARGAAAMDHRVSAEIKTQSSKPEIVAERASVSSTTMVVRAEHAGLRYFTPLDKRSVLDTAQQLKLNISAAVFNNYAKTTVTSVQENDGTDTLDVVFSFKLPEEALLSGLRLQIGDAVYVGVVKPKVIAEQDFQDAVDAGETAGLLSSRGTNLFQVAMSTPAGVTATFRIDFEELLLRRVGYYEYMVNVNPGVVVPELHVAVALYNQQGVRDVHSPSHSGAKVVTTSDESVHVSWQPSISEQAEERGDLGVAADFSVRYRLRSEPPPGWMAVAPSGFFVHTFAAPSYVESVGLSIVFVLDRSGSMGNVKMQQARGALALMLDELTVNDRFAVITFDDVIHVLAGWSTVEYATASHVATAKTALSTVNSGGSTNISGAMQRAVTLLAQRAARGNGEQDAPVMLLLTDGDPTSGITNHESLRTYIRTINSEQVNATVFALGFGFNLKFDLLRAIAYDGFGFDRRIYEDQDAVEQLTGFFAEVSSAKLVDVQYDFGVALVNVTRPKRRVLFAGSEMLVVGRVSGSVTTVPLRIDAASCSCRTSWLAYHEANGGANNLVDAERIVAFMEVKTLLRDFTSASTVEARLAAKQRATALALLYEFVTPFTSLVVTEAKGVAPSSPSPPPPSPPSGAPPPSPPSGAPPPSPPSGGGGGGFSCPYYDHCGICQGDGSSCLDCAGVPNSPYGSYDACGVCGGDGSSCLDCASIPNGPSTYDVCDVCAGNGSSCRDCLGVANGAAVYDACDVCNGDGSTCSPTMGEEGGDGESGDQSVDDEAVSDPVSDAFAQTIDSVMSLREDAMAAAARLGGRHDELGELVSYVRAAADRLKGVCRRAERYWREVAKRGEANVDESSSEWSVSSDSLSASTSRFRHLVPSRRWRHLERTIVRAKPSVALEAGALRKAGSDCREQVRSVVDSLVRQLKEMKV